MLSVYVSAGLLLVSAAAALLKKIVLNQLARVRFKKSTKGLPICPGASLIDNHTRSLMFGRNTCQGLLQLHKQLGKTIGFFHSAKPAVSTTDLDLVKTFILDEPDQHTEKAQVGVPLDEVEKSILLVGGEAWRKVRRVIAPAFTPNKFKAPNVREEIDRSIGNLVDYIEHSLAEHGPEHLFDIDDAAHKYALDLIFRCFYKQEHIIDFRDPHDKWTGNVDRQFASLQTDPLVKFSTIFPFLRNLINAVAWYLPPRVGYHRRKMLEFVRSQVVRNKRARLQLQRLQREAAATGAQVDPNNFELGDGTRYKRNMVDHIIDKYVEGRLTDEEYDSNSVFLLGAADRTSMDTISFTIYLLSVHQHIQDKLRKCILADGPDAEYLDWTLKESLRLLPPAPVSCSRTVSRDIEIGGGHVVPKGTYVLANAFVFHHLEEYWGPDVEEFRPERWQDTSSHHPVQYIPFGAGVRSCPGKAFAVHELKLLFTALLTRYRFEGEPREDALEFDSPLWIFVLPRSVTRCKIRRLSPDSGAAA